ncbi:unnamed protein product [Prorocentrum cordatum]|uniref:Reverse transcriptase domain-containing protein n=1 Tax=Prorocentrum cordatum TaxID=2364126 RepID=A0ABN9S7B7_9DINO|nr:unnamed protein product [Polarella glacialis]
MSAPLLNLLESGVGRHTKRDRAWLKPVVEVLASNGIESPEDLVKLNVRAATFQLNGLVEGKVAFIERAVAKATQSAEQQAAAEAAAPSGSQEPVSALLQALQGGRRPAVHVDIAAGLGGMTLAGLPASCWPSPQLTDWVQGRVKAAESKGIAKPFLYMPIKKFPPYYAADKRQPDDPEGECGVERSFAQEIARGICKARGPDKKQGDLPSILQWCVAFDRWAIVAALAGQMPLTASMAHKEVVMQLALSARASGRATAIAVLYDEIARREWADLSAGLGAFDVAAAAQSQNAATVLGAERECDARGIQVVHDRAPAQPKGKAKGASRGHKGGSDHSAKGGKAMGYGKERKGKPANDSHRWQGHYSSGIAASGAQSAAEPVRVQSGAVLPDASCADLSCFQSAFDAASAQALRGELAPDEVEALRFTRGALGRRDAQPKRTDVQCECMEALRWSAARSLRQCIKEREERVRRIEARAAHFEASGEAEAARKAAPPEFRPLIAGVNIPLLKELARESEWHDAECIDFFSRGAPLLGNLEYSGNGRALSPEERAGDTGAEVARLRASALACNDLTLASIREDPLASELLRKTREKADLGRMSPPRAFRPDISAAELAAAWGETIGLVPRFGVSQPKPDGSLKVRPVDDFTRSRVSGACAPAEKLSVEGADQLVAVARAFFELHGALPELWKADIDSACRRIPLAPADRWAAVSVFKEGGRLWCSQHLVCPFGALASCHDWDRVAAMLSHFARRLAKLPVSRYVDDYFAPDRPGAADHAMRCFARIVRAALGSDAVADAKLARGAQLVVLGLLISFCAQGVRCEPACDKRLKWSFAIRSVARASARDWDHAALVHGIWSLAARMSLSMWVRRVPSKSNISNGPSREVYSLLHLLGARQLPAVLDARFHAAEAWEALWL